MECTQLKGNVLISDSLTEIGISTFSLTQITGVTVVEDDTPGVNLRNITTLGKEAFANCFQLQGNVLISKSLATIGLGMFVETQITGVTVVDDSTPGVNLRHITTLGSSAFFNCTQLEGNVLINASLTTIGNKTFNNTAITGVTVVGDPTPGVNLTNITTLGLDVFKDCTSLHAFVTLSPVIQRIQYAAFLNSPITNDIITLPQTLNAIGVGSFPENITLHVYSNTTVNLQILYDSNQGSLSLLSELPPGLSCNTTTGLLSGFVSSGTYPDIMFKWNSLYLIFTLIIGIPCLSQKTRILTEGFVYKQICDIHIGDQVVSPLSNKLVKVTNISKRSITNKKDVEDTNTLYKVSKYSLGDLPHEDLFISGHHRVILKIAPEQYVGIQMCKLCFGVKLTDTEFQSAIDEGLTYYNLELEDKREGFFAEGLPVESMQ